MRAHLTFAAAAAATLLLSASVEAQSRGKSGGATQAGAPRSANADAAAPGWMPMELGMDGEFAFTMSDPHATIVGLPVSQIRAAFAKSPTWSIEPSLAFNYIGVDGGSANELRIGVGALYHFSESRAANQWYARPFIGMNHASQKTDAGGGVTTTVSSNQLGLGGGFGIKMPIMSRLAGRYEVNLSHFFESDAAAAATKLGFMAGFSFYTR